MVQAAADLPLDAASGEHKVSEPLPTEVMASGLCAVVIRSQVSNPAPVSSAPEPESELPATNLTQLHRSLHLRVTQLHRNLHL